MGLVGVNTDDVELGNVYTLASAAIVSVGITLFVAVTVIALEVTNDALWQTLLGVISTVTI